MKPLPPYAQLLRLRTDEQDDALRFVMPFHEDVVGRPGFLHGGAIAGLLEFAAFTALVTGDRRGASSRSRSRSRSTICAAGRRGTRYAEARIERLGNRMANVEAFAWQGERDKPIASARINFLLDRLRSSLRAELVGRGTMRSMVEGPSLSATGPSTAFGGPPPHRFATGRI